MEPKRTDTDEEVRHLLVRVASLEITSKKALSDATQRLERLETVFNGMPKWSQRLIGWSPKDKRQ